MQRRAVFEQAIRTPTRQIDNDSEDIDDCKEVGEIHFLGFYSFTRCGTMRWEGGSAERYGIEG